MLWYIYGTMYGCGTDGAVTGKRNSSRCVQVWCVSVVCKVVLCVCLFCLCVFVCKCVYGVCACVLVCACVRGVCVGGGGGGGGTQCTCCYERFGDVLQAPCRG